MSRSVVVRLSMDAADYIRNAQKAGDVGEDAMQKVERSAKSTDQALDSVGSTAGKIAAGGIATLFATGKAAMDWESQWAGVTKTVEGSAEEIAGVETGLRDLAKTLPATHEEIAGVAEAAGQLGVATGDVVDFTKTMIDLSETTNLTAEGAATSIAQISNVMGTAAGDVDNFGSALVALGNDGASTEAQILDMAQRIAGAGAQIGLAETDILAIANAAASMGIEAEAGGSAISRVFTELAKATKQGGEGLEDFAEVAGMSASDFAESFERDPARAFASFTQGLNRINESGGDVFTTLDDLGMSDVRVSQALLSMAASGDLLTDSLDLGAEAWRENTALAAEAEKRYGTTASEVQVAWNQIKDSGIEAGEVLLPIIAGVAGAVGEIASAFGELPDGVQAGIMVAVMALTGAGGLVWATTRVIAAVQATKAVMATLGFASRTAATDLDGVGTSAKKADRSFAAMAGRAAGVAAVGMAVGMLADEVGRIDSSNIDRSLEALSRGTVTDDMSDVIDDLGTVTSKLNAVDAGEIVTLFGLFGDTTLDKAADNIDQVDQSLARMVETGQSTEAMALVREIIEDSGLSAEDAAEQFDAYELALDNAQSASSDAAAGTDDFAGAMDGAADSALRQAEALMESIDAMREARSEAIRGANAEVNYHSALDAARGALKANGRTLDVTTEKGRANRSLLIDLAGSWNNLTDEQKNAQGASRSARSEFIKIATQLGMTKREARAYADELMEIPPKRTTKVELEGAASVEAELNRLARERNSVIRVSYLHNPGKAPKGTAPNQTTEADGGVLDFYANGGVTENHVAQIADASTVRVWAEPETMGEAYIPLAPSKRARSIDIWHEAGRRLGTMYADGAVVAPTLSRAVTPQDARSITAQFSGDDIAAIAEAVYSGTYDGAAQLASREAVEERIRERLGR